MQKQRKYTKILAAIILGTVLPYAIAYSMKKKEKIVEKDIDGLYDYKLFKVIQRIYDLVDKVGEESKKNGTDISSGKKGWPEPNPYRNQTKQGLFFEDTECLWTPWGRVTVTEENSGSVLGCLAFKQELLKNFKVSLFRVRKLESDISDADELKCYILKSNDVIDLEELCPKKYSNFFQKVSAKEFDSMKGKNVFVATDLGDYLPIYSIHEVKGQKIPKPELLRLCDYRKCDDVMLAWKTMVKKFERQKVRIQKRTRAKK